MVATVPPTINYKPALATARLIAQSAARIQEWHDRKRFWSCAQPDMVMLDAFEQKMLRVVFDKLIAEETADFQYLLRKAIREAGDAARQRKANAQTSEVAK